MKNLMRSNFQAHPFHLVSPSPWPLFTCIALFTLTTAGIVPLIIILIKYLINEKKT
jgi:cytochrome c oxidase subunit 3